MAARGENFSLWEEKQLCIAFLHVSQDPIVGNAQKYRKLWDRVQQQFLDNVGRTPSALSRTSKSLEAKWAAIKKETTKFAGNFSTIQSLDISGTSDEDLIVKALDLYRSKHEKEREFQYLECWRILREVPRWTEMSSVLRKNSPLADMANPGSLEQTSCGSEATDKQASESLSPPTPAVEVFKRPQGTRKAKDAAKKQKIQENTLLPQAQAAKELTASIIEKTKFMKEQAMRALFLIRDDDGKLSDEGKEFFQLRRARELALFKKSLESNTVGSPSSEEEDGAEEEDGWSPSATNCLVDNSNNQEGPNKSPWAED